MPLNIPILNTDLGRGRIYDGGRLLWNTYINLETQYTLKKELVVYDLGGPYENTVMKGTKVTVDGLLGMDFFIGPVIGAELKF